MTPEQEGPAVGAELEQELRNIARAKFIFDYDGKVLPVTNLFDREGDATDCPELATSCVAYDADSKHPQGKWLCFGNLEPGEVWRKTDGEAPRQNSAGCN